MSNQSLKSVTGTALISGGPDYCLLILYSPKAGETKGKSRVCVGHCCWFPVVDFGLVYECVKKVYLGEGSPTTRDATFLLLQAILFLFLNPSLDFRFTKVYSNVGLSLS